MKTNLHGKALDLLHSCATPHGFVASTHSRHNYYRIWSRDGAAMGLAALATGDEALIRTLRHGLETLMHYQGAQGEIPSNVDPKRGSVSFGHTAGRVDATTWFVVAFGQYCKHTGDAAFAKRHLASMQKAVDVLEAWEFNRKGFLYVPASGDWADEFIQRGYILYDQVLYYAALRNFCQVLRMARRSDAVPKKKAAQLAKLIQANYWIHDIAPTDAHVYHPSVMKRGKRLVRAGQEYWMPMFSPSGYEKRFDAMANILVSLAGLATPAQQKHVDDYVAKHCGARTDFLIPAFQPVITPSHPDWEKLRSAYVFAFRNKPHEYHNGGLWPMLTGLYAADLAVRGKHALARQYVDGLAAANCPATGGKAKEFPEYLHGKTKRPKGVFHMGWNAATALIALHALETGKVPFV